MNEVILNKKAQKQLRKLPAHIQGKLQHWVESVEEFGIEEIRMIPGYHDEPLTGKRSGQRSIRLSKSYRAFYVEHGNKLVLEIIEVNKHDY
nr:type II toxin-antitoxin system mRNA interferase toxin, RelE/StbE family [uncultured Desulfobacter sp.]